MTEVNNKERSISVYDPGTGTGNSVIKKPFNTQTATNYIVYPGRWAILIIFMLYATSNAVQGVQYSIIQDAVVKYYDVSSMTVTWTSLIYMTLYTLLVFPGSWFVDKMGLRISVIIGSFGTSLGSWLKVFSVPQDRFWLGFIGQMLGAASQVFVINVPPKLAAVWFGADQVSSACSMGVFGYQLGLAVGFVLPPMLVHTQDSIEELAAEFQLLYYIIAGFCSALFVLILLFFKAAPATPPSAAADVMLSINFNFLHSIKSLFTNRNYVLLVISYGINVGVYCAISAVINELILSYYPGANKDVGFIAVIFVIIGMFGTIICGYILDRIRKFKETALTVYAGAVVSMFILTFTLNSGYIGIAYLSSAILGFFMVGYLPVGFELASEVTYPVPEAITSGILNAAVQASGVAITLLYQWIFDSCGVLWANVGFCVLLTLGTVVTTTIKSDLRRQAICNKTETSYL